MRPLLPFLFSMSLIACGDKEEVDPLTTDDDGDGFSEEQGDCNDDNIAVAPGKDEVCDGVDNDCDDLIDDADDSLLASTGSIFYADNDRDGFGNPDDSIEACNSPDTFEYVENGSDCDDDNDEIHPDGTEICDGLDNDCDEKVDDEDNSLDASTGFEFFVDADGDGDGQEVGSIMACEMPDGYAPTNTDCDDSSENAAWYNSLDADNDGLTTCGEDTDADGIVDERDCDDSTATVGSTDADGDGYVACIDDCDDSNAFINPGAGTGETDPTLCVLDADEDGYGDMNPPEGVDAGTDCDDSDYNLSYNDTDGDGIASCAGDCDDNDPAVGVEDLDGDGFSGCLDDCLDSEADDDGDGIPDSAAVYPGAASLEPHLCTADVDGDGYGDALASEHYNSNFCFRLALVDSGSYWDNAAITVISDNVLVGSYTNTSASSSNTEENFTVCTVGNTTLDYTCTSTYDCSAHTWRVYGDENNDGVYDDLLFEDGRLVTGFAPTQGITFSLNLSIVEEGSDCYDNDASSLGDNDGDGYMFCIDDCDDGDAAINPAATEIYYDAIDQNCDEMSDFDEDGDGYDIFAYDCDGDGNPDRSCDTDGDGIIDWRGGLDCDDNDASTYGDDDGDGFLSCGDDCDDSNASINPATPETYYNGIDSNCNPADEFDQDGDGDNIAEFDCDADGNFDASCDLDADGIDDFFAGTDCDDTSAGLDGLDSDNDGFTSCINSDGLSDCDDNDALTYPGAAYNEVSYVAGDFSTYVCGTDVDGDGYGASPDYDCYTIEMTDAYGDGWNGNSIEVYEDGVWMASFSNNNTINGIEQSETEWATYCPVSGHVTFEYADGDFSDEVSFALYYDNGGNGVLLGEGQLSEPNSLTFGVISTVNFLDGEVFYSELWGVDADDEDPNVH